MKKYIFKERKIEEEYRYIFLCGVKYGRNEPTDKRNVLRAYLLEYDCNLRPIILEDNFMFGRKSKRLLRYGDINMQDLYQVEMVMNYLADNNIIIQESISTGAEIGLFLSEPGSLKKTCLLVPDKIAVEEDKLGEFIRRAFVNAQNKVYTITFYPRIEKNLLSENVKNWHTSFFENEIGTNLGNKIMSFLDDSRADYTIQFSDKISNVKKGYIGYEVRKGNLKITALPRLLLCCIASVFNIREIYQEIFNRTKEMKEYIRVIKEALQEIFMNTIMEKTGETIKECSIKVCWNIESVYIGQLIGMSLYLFQAAGFMTINKDELYLENHKVTINRTVLQNKDGTNFFFYEKYKNCLGTLTETQIV